MKNKGFTLAEVLITLGIIGVVAALTTPALLHNVGTAEIGPKLAKFRSTVENANKMMLVENDVNRLSVLIRRAGQDAGSRTNRYTGLLQNFMRIDGGADSYAVKAYSGGGDLVSVNVSLFEDAHGANDNIQGNNPNRIQVALQDNNGDATGFTFRTVEGMAVHFFLAPQVAAAAAAGAATEPDNLGVILVDINSNREPNRLGRDVFGFVLRNDGMLTPIGSRDVRSGIGDAFDNDANSWQNSCPDQNGNVTSQGLTCTGSIFANDLKVVYDE